MKRAEPCGRATGPGVAAAARASAACDHHALGLGWLTPARTPCSGSVQLLTPSIMAQGSWHLVPHLAPPGRGMRNAALNSFQIQAPPLDRVGSLVEEADSSHKTLE